ncbi:MAG: Transcription-repair-coupling factor [Verrucomicrobia subdivision 3 bacterium]|nr:Transcription-repair-coupling factor [Limisphaerales bacterium]MCS1415438.1 Transcription-repair-coupling factor [Limisphaerales bacterium]
MVGLGGYLSKSGGQSCDRFEARFAGTSLVEALGRRLQVSGGVIEEGLAPASWSFLAALIHRLEPGAPLLLAASGLERQEALHRDFQIWREWLGGDLGLEREAGGAEWGDFGGACFFPEREGLAHEARGRAGDAVRERLETVMALRAFRERAGGEAPVVVASGAGLLQKTFSLQGLEGRVKAVGLGQELDPLDLVEWLEGQAYEPEAKVTQKGELALRGGIVDVFPLASRWPLRIEFWGSEVGSIRRFDPQTQLSREEVASALISPGGEIDILQREFEGAGGEGAASLSEHLPEGAILILCDPGEVEDAAGRMPRGDRFTEGWAVFRERVRARGFRVFHWRGGLEGALADLGERGAGRGAVSDAGEDFSGVGLGFAGLDGYGPLGVLGFGGPVGEGRRLEFFEQLHRWLRQGWRVDVFCRRAGECDRFRGMWSELGWGFFEGALGVGVGMLGGGFLLEAGRWAVVTGAELFGRRKTRGRRRLGSGPAAGVERGREIDFSDLAPGDYVVHVEHGIGRFMGLGRLDPGGGRSEVSGSGGGGQFGPECLVVEYASRACGQGPARLYVPVGEAHLVSKYVGAGKGRPALHRLGGHHWVWARARAQRAVADLAGELLAVEAAREAGEGHAFGPDTEWQREFEGAFDYEESADQRRAIESSKRDMEARKPMDRLICGDAGFGKTEVALRAAFKAVMGGKQAAFLAPTTVLALQHYRHFVERLAGYPFRVELLSRLQKRREAGAIVGALARGEVDIVVGTHRLVQGDVIFRDLGLVVIDEEQRFGVRHKEKFKRLRKLVDVLTLSATPIPRTLHLALMGGRDMSVIETPPPDRLPVETIVARYDEGTIVEAIERELARGGQVYFLHNRVATIERATEKLGRLVPGARVVVGHGRMSAGALEGVMAVFVSGEADVLVSTAIIESGLDIPNANTIIIDRADRFGLSDLYQLRGRVGRYKHQAYAYLLLPRHGGLLAGARKRIAAVKEHSHLGSGFKIAMRDLEIRGAGSILGPRQSGHITAVGFELYCQLLKQSIAALKGEAVKPRVEVRVAFDFLSLDSGVGGGEDGAGAGLSVPGAALRYPAHIPYGYIGEARQRIEFYRKLAQANDGESLRQLRRELRDRYGPLPRAVRLLLLVAGVKRLAGERDIRSIETRGGEVRLTGNRGLVMVGGRFPRLREQAPEARLGELRGLLLSM